MYLVRSGTRCSQPATRYALSTIFTDISVLAIIMTNNIYYAQALLAYGGHGNFVLSVAYRCDWGVALEFFAEICHFTLLPKYSPALV